MNAPATAASVTPASFEQIPLTSIRVSMTQIQQLRRQHFEAPKLLELADSIRAQGLLQPILVRPVKPEGTTKYEVVCGERRWLAADRAGLAHIDCNVRVLTDHQVLEAQLVENLQREDVHPLEEAEGYRELMKLKSYTADELGVLIGKSRGYIYARMKLLNLCQEARAAVDTGLLDPSKALLVARIGSEKLQKRALKIATEKNWRGDPISHREALDRIRDKLMADLTKAPFKLNAAFGEGNALPACTGCPHYSVNDPELTAQPGASARMCTDTPCFERKVKVHYQLARAAAEASGATVLTGDAAKAALTFHWDGDVNDKYVRLDAESSEDFPEPEPKETGDEAADDKATEAWERRYAEFEPRTYRQLLADKAPTIVLAEDSKGQLVELVPVKEAAKLLKTVGYKLDIPTPQRSMHIADNAEMKAEREKQEERQQRETEIRTRVYRELFAKWKPPLKRDDLAMIAKELLDNGYADQIQILYPDLDVVEKLDEARLARFLVMFCLAGSVVGYGSPTELYAVAKRFRIDPDKIKKEVAAEARAKSAPDKSPAAAGGKSAPKKKAAKK